MKDPDMVCNITKLLLDMEITKKEFSNNVLWHEIKTVVEQYGNLGGYDLQMK